MGLTEERRLLIEDGERLPEWVPFNEFKTKWIEFFNEADKPAHRDTILSFYEDYMTGNDETIEEYLRGR